MGNEEYLKLKKCIESFNNESKIFLKKCEDYNKEQELFDGVMSKACDLREDMSDLQVKEIEKMLEETSDTNNKLEEYLY